MYYTRIKNWESREVIYKETAKYINATILFITRGYLQNAEIKYIHNSQLFLNSYD